MNQAYNKIKNIYSLHDIYQRLTEIEDSEDVIVFLDWDDTLVNPDTNRIIEPKETKELINYMRSRKIYFAIITGRFYTTVCDENARNINEIKQNIINTMHPSFRLLGIDTSKYLSSLYTDTIYSITNEHNECVGILYMGLFFSGKKGEAIKNYLRQTGITKKHILFVDDYDPYLKETVSNVPNVEAYRRKI